MEKENTQSTGGGGNKNLILIGVVALIIIALIAAGGFVLTKNKSQTNVLAPAENNNVTEQPSSDSTEPSGEPQSSIYKQTNRG